jgi:hypothetical protein
MRRLMHLGAFIFGLAIPTACLGAERVALVIGNAAYTSAPSLANPRNDGKDIAEALRTLQFEVVEGFDLNKEQMDSKIREFSRQASVADTVLFFYAGHGMQVGGTNYLLPVDAQLLDSSALDFETVELDKVIRNMQGPSKTALIFLDACRNNPLTRNFAQMLGPARAVGIGRGLAPSTASGDGLFIAFATAPNDISFDGAGRNSPFTAALLRNITIPQIEIQQIMTRVKADVYDSTAGRQRPWHNSDLRNEVYLALSPDEKDRPAQPPKTVVAGTNFLPDPSNVPKISPATAFGTARKIGTLRGWDRFLELHGDTEFAYEAKAMRSKVWSDLTKNMTAEDNEQRLALTADQRANIQSVLGGLGYQIGTNDGQFGPRTRSQISEYQRSKGMAATGYVDYPFLLSGDFRSISISPSLAPTVFDPAKSLDPDDVATLETDERIIRAAGCLRGAQISYAAFEGHLYVSVYQAFTTWKHAHRIGQGCGAHLVSIGSEAENEFVFRLIERDEKMFQTGFDGAYTYRQGPWIGLAQDQTASEPDGGWTWSTGEKLEYTNWLPGQPNGNYADDDYGLLFAQRGGRSDGSDLKARTWDDQGIGARVRGFVLEFE